METAGSDRLKASYASYLNERTCRHVLLGCHKRNARKIIGSFIMRNDPVACTTLPMSTDPVEEGALDLYDKTKIESAFRHTLSYEGRGINSATTSLHETSPIGSRWILVISLLVPLVFSPATCPTLVCRF